MANEIQISAVTGLSPTIQLYSGATPIGTPFSATEIASTGEYVANMPSSTPYGLYLVLVTVGSDIKIGSGEIYWDGNYEVENGMAILIGLDPSNPSNTNRNTRKWTAGDITINMTGDLIDDTTMTRE